MFYKEKMRHKAPQLQLNF